MKNIFLLVLSVVILGALHSCDDETILIGGEDNYITNFVLTAESGVAYKGLISDGEITMQVPEGISLNGAAASVTISGESTISPDPQSITNWDDEEVFKVSSYNATNRMYAYKIERTDVSTLGNVTLTSQAEVDAFAEQGLTVIDGNLIIGKAAATASEDTITDLSALNSLQEIIYNIVINKTYVGKDLAGLSNLEKIGGVKVESVDSLENISFPNLKTIGTNVNIVNSKLKTISLPALTQVGESFCLKSDSLTTAEFDELLTIGESLTFNGATATNGSVSTMKTIAFPKLQSVGDAFTLSGWGEAYKVELPALTRVLGTATISYLTTLETLDLDVLNEVGGLAISNMTALSIINAPKLDEVNGDLSVAGVTSLLSVSFNSIKNISGSLTLNAAAASSASFNALESIGSKLSIPSAARNLSVLTFPKLKTIGGSLEVKSTGYIEFGGFTALEEIGGQFYLYNNTNITTLPGLPAIKKVGEYYLYGLTALTELDVRGQEVGKIDALTTTLDNLKIIGDELFDGSIIVNSPQKSFPEMIELQGFKKIKYLQLRNFSYYEEPLILAGIEEIETMLDLSSLSKATEISFPDLKSVGKINITYGNKLEKINFPALTEITGYEDAALSYASSSALAEFNMPLLTTVTGSFAITSLRSTATLSHLNTPELSTVNGTISIAGSSNTSITDVSNFSKLSSATSVNISGLKSLADFSGFANVVPSLSSDTWSVASCAYNPTYQNMLDEAYTATND
ncbi:MAG: leucine-rich repeat protein [Mangrovibacterium sp.]